MRCCFFPNCWGVWKLAFLFGIWFQSGSTIRARLSFYCKSFLDMSYDDRSKRFGFIEKISSIYGVESINRMINLNILL